MSSIKSCIKYCTLSLMLLFCFIDNTKGQFVSVFTEFEDTLKKLGPIILNGKDDFVRYEANEKFLMLFEEALTIDDSFDYPFDSLITISRLVSPDKKFKIFSWNLPLADGTYEHFGIIQSYNSRKKQYDIYLLQDKSDEIITLEYQVLNENNWYGAHYYKLIYIKSRSKQYYTLLGWDGNDNLSTKKVIEILSFRSTGKPVFGAYIFRNYKKRTKRIIFEYSSRAAMTLTYSTQHYDVVTVKRKKRGPRKNNKWKKQKAEEKKINRKKIKAKMIIFDRLVPLDLSLEGQYQFYVPVTHIYDALIFQKGKWVFIKDIDARNPKQPEYKKPTNRPQKDFYTPK